MALATSFPDLQTTNDGERMALWRAWHGQDPGMPIRDRGQTVNQRSVGLGALVLWDFERWVDECVQFLADQAEHGHCRHEPTSGNYDELHFEGVGAMLRAAHEHRHAELYAQALRWLLSALAVWSLMRSRGAIRAPGARTGDAGSEVRDALFDLFTGELVKGKSGAWWALSANMAAAVALDLLLSGAVTVQQVDRRYLPRLAWVLTVDLHANGYRAFYRHLGTPALGWRDCYGGPWWGELVVDGESLASVSWRDLTPIWKRRKKKKPHETEEEWRRVQEEERKHPEAVSMGGGPMPRELPFDRRLGRRIEQVVVGPDRPVPPLPAVDFGGTPPPPPPPVDRVEVLQLHDGGELPVRIRQDGVLEVVR